MVPRLSILVPAYNEAARLEQTLERLRAFAEGLEGGAEVLVVDDGSTDGTADLVDRLAASNVRAIRLERNRGKGAALRAGVAAAAGKEILLCDADLSTPIEEYPRLAVHLAAADLVLGSRAVADSRIALAQPWYREVMGKVFNRLVRVLVVGGIRDTQCGFKLIRGAVARQLFAVMVVDRFAFDVELIWLARRHGFVVEEVGVVWRDSPQSRVHPVRDSSRMLIDLVRIRWRHRGGRATVPALRSAEPTPRGAPPGPPSSLPPLPR